MSTAAIAMMVLALVVIWGGLVLACINIARHPEGSVALLDDDGRPLETHAA